MLLPTNRDMLQAFAALKDTAALGTSSSGPGPGPAGEGAAPPAGESSASSKSGEGGAGTVDWAELLDPHGPHKLMYSLQIVESLSRPPKHRSRSTVSDVSQLRVLCSQ